jgi:hypothetical protein
MKRKDFIFILFLVSMFLPFLILEPVYSFYDKFNLNHGFITAFIKFAILATSGELIGLRIRTGNYFIKGFGILPRMIVWGFLGLLIKAAFVIFSAGVPHILSYLGMDDPASILISSFSGWKLLVAFCISIFLNMFFSPVLMTLHKITDTHIQNNSGDIALLCRKIDIEKVLTEIDWKMHWGFVLKKSIPLFWIPAHTLTFLLPADFQILFAAILGVILGVILAFAAVASTDNQQILNR